MQLSLPLIVHTGKTKKFSLNLNEYRNAHYYTLNSAKIAFKELIAHDILKLPKFNVIELEYTVYPRTKRDLDISNICSIVDKFFSDALVEMGKLEDDCFRFLTKVSYAFGEIDKENPRVDVQIKETTPMKRTILLTLEPSDIQEAVLSYVASHYPLQEGETYVLEEPVNFALDLRVETTLPQTAVSATQMAEAVSQGLVPPEAVQSAQKTPAAAAKQAPVGLPPEELVTEAGDEAVAETVDETEDNTAPSLLEEKPVVETGSPRKLDLTGLKKPNISTGDERKEPEETAPEAQAEPATAPKPLTSIFSKK